VGATQAFDRVLVVEAGRIVEQGTPADLAACPESRYRAMLEAEVMVREGLWSSDVWRRLWLADGRLVETCGNEDTSGPEGTSCTT
jgi:ABC-type sulfate/molybdate transport systems ATPase subunit